MAEYIDKIEVVNKLIRLENKYQFYKAGWDADTLYRNIVKLEIEIGKQLPADVAPVRHGRWEHHYHDSGSPIDDKWYCSECNMCNGHKRTWYCPNCGAKMDLE